MIKVLLIPLLSFVFCLSAKARSVVPRPETSSSDFIVEPYLGYETGYLTQTGIPAIKNTGLNFGARLGYNLVGVGLGLDYMTGSQSSEQNDIKSDYKPTDYGIFLDYRFSFGVNIYGSYFLSSKSKLQSSDNTADFSGTGLKFGIGWQLYSFLDVNLETIARTYTKYDSAKLTNSLVGSSTGLSLSVPLW